MAMPVGEWDKVFPKSDKVEHTKVAFKNRFGIKLVADFVDEPVEVRYCWGTFAEPNLVNGAKLPAMPFRAKLK